MKIPSERTLLDMELAAELRAAGATWDTVGEKLRRRPFVVQRWGKLYPDEWQRLLRQAEERLARHGSNETRSTMRTMLRHENMKLRLGAADQLTKLLRAEQAQRPSDNPQEDLAAFLSHVEEISDEELEAILAEFVQVVYGQQLGAKRRDDRGGAELDEVRGGAVDGPQGAD